MRHIHFVGSFPPPVGGKAVINEALASHIARIAAVTRVDIGPPSLRRDLRYHATRMRRFVVALGSYMGAQKAKLDTLYVSLDAGLGLAYQIPIICLGVATGRQVYVHHHSFAYIDRWSAVVAAMLTFGGRAAAHVFLCGRMRGLFVARYRAPVNALILSNAAFIDRPRITSRAREHGIMRIGLIGHLSSKKGADVVLEVVAAARRNGLDVRGILAGPMPEEAEAAELRRRMHELGDACEWRGEVSGEQKERFYRDLDLFVFPTRFKDEAQPVVLFEAASRGIPILSYGRGCIRDDCSEVWSVVEPDEDFVGRAVCLLKTLMEDPGAYERASVETLRHFTAARVAAESQLKDLLRQLASELVGSAHDEK